MNIYIKRDVVKFDKELEELKNPSLIIIHHTEEIGWNIHKVHNHHKTLGWEGIGYNYFIEENGTIIEGRGMHIGAHTKGFNNKSIGICLNGNFDLSYPSKEQIKSLCNMCNMLMQKYNIPIESVIGHREVEGVTKSCPGYYFNMNEFRRYLFNGLLL
ncbi:peptidoglycan recognition protein family protein [Clostridium sardiniense]|uniref:peptidoglycan recognition protein family protein n=1 Tax=Clostridium sardiniense TaxID=29369 RepID=UPI00195BEF44|nr:peptidoglycan recognition family protein [Clostridium sardiniense]MBM7833323.1 N-acetylmuramoyl-L-alanine amidase [Clostridium sardiniense]